VVDGASALLRRYPGYPELDRVLLLGAEAADRVGEGERVIRFAEALLDRFPRSPHRRRMLWLETKQWRAMGRPEKAADALCRLVQEPLDSLERVRASGELRRLMRRRLSPEQMERLAERYPDSPVEPELAFLVAERAFAAARYDEAYRLLGEFLYRYPADPNAPRARQLLRAAAERMRVPGQARIPYDPTAIGLLLPRTGRLAEYGRAFQHGVELAVEEMGGRGAWRLVLGATRGGPVAAARAVRRLLLEEGVAVLLGGLSAEATVGAAIEANAWGVPFLSPLVDTESLRRVGPWVFLNRIPGEVEVTVVAREARARGYERFAILSPAEGRRYRLAAFFRREVERLGGRVVAWETYAPGETDFRAPLEALRAEAPEALFLPAPPEELVLILPQVAFYDLALRLLGLSDWAHPKVLRLAGAQAEGALFPAESFHGADPSREYRFERTYRERYGVRPGRVARSAYFGALTVLEAVRTAPASRAAVRDRLERNLWEDPARRLAEADQLALLTVRNGRLVEALEAPSLASPPDTLDLSPADPEPD
jgi:branched-chain amino acid transport system substrate-binding protein